MSYPRFSILSFGIVLNDVGTVCKQITPAHSYQHYNHEQEERLKIKFIHMKKRIENH